MSTLPHDETHPVADQLCALTNRVLNIADCTFDSTTRRRLLDLADDMRLTENQASRHEQQARKMERALDAYVENAQEEAVLAQKAAERAKLLMQVAQAAWDSGGNVVLVSKWFPRVMMPVDGGAV